MRPLRALVLVGLLAAAGCGHAPLKPYQGWRVYRTKHITMYAATSHLHSTTQRAFELAYATLAGSLFASRRIAPVEVLFLEDPMMTATLGRFREAVTLARLPGQGSLARRGLIVVREGSFDREALHQLTHAFIHAMAPRAPLWLHEAYAGFMETAQYRSGGGQQTACLAYLGPSGPMVKLEELFNWKWSELDAAEKTEWFRDAGRALVDYLMMAENGALRTKMGELADRVAGGEETAAALAAVLPGVSLADLAKRIEDHRAASETDERGFDVRSESACPWPFPIPAERAADLESPRVEPVEPQDIQELIERLRMLPRRQGRVDWYPPAVLTVEGLARN